MILVTGLSGMVGKYIEENLKKSQLSYLSLSRKELDLENLNSVKDALEGKKFSHFIHLAAETNVDLCETRPKHAYTCNFYATKMIAEYCEKAGARMIFISTSAVFGTQGKMRYCELDIPFPTNIYGLTKYFAESAVQKICKNYLIIRAGWMIGGGKDRDKKFVGKLISQLHEGKNTVSAVFDKFGSITSAKYLAKTIVDSLNIDFIGIKHIASNDICSRYEMAQFIIKKLNANCSAEPVSSASFPLAATRAASEAIHSIVPTQLIEDTPYSWAALTNTYLEEEFNV